MPTLGVNIDHVATLRQARLGQEPDPVEAAVLCARAGADGITVHLREDRRHIQERDVRELRHAVSLPLNLEMAATPAMVKLACEIGPDMATLVPERREELTTEGGLDAAGRVTDLKEAVKALRAAGIAVSLFIEPDIRQVEAAVAVGAGLVEFHTGVYANGFDAGLESVWKTELDRLEAMTRWGIDQGIEINMGHGLNIRNVSPIVAIAGVRELNIGHSIMSRAILIGMDRAVREMKALL